MRVAELVTALLLAALSLYFMWESGQPSWEGDPLFQNIWYSREGIGSGFWPFWLSLIMFLSCVWTMANWMRRRTPPSQSTEPYLDRYGWIMLLKVGGAVTAFIALIEIAGMYGAMTLFLVYYIAYLGRHPWPTTLAIAIAAPVVTFFFFDVAMRIVLPKGYLEPLFLPLYDIFL